MFSNRGKRTYSFCNEWVCDVLTFLFGVPYFVMNGVWNFYTKGVPYLVTGAEGVTYFVMNDGMTF